MNPSSHILDPQTIRFERLLPGPIERVWEYLTQPDLQRTWLAESAGDFSGVARCRPHRSIEYSMPDSSIVSLELEPRGAKVRLVLTHRRFPAWLAGTGTVLVAAFLAFSFCQPKDGIRQPQRPGLQVTQSTPSLNSLHSSAERSHFTLC